MRLSHASPAVSAVFDDPNLVSCAGLAPVLALALRPAEPGRGHADADAEALRAGSMRI